MSNRDNEGCFLIITGIMFWGIVVGLSVLGLHILLAFLCAVTAVFLTWLTKSFFEDNPKCPHGVRGGDKKRKCAICVEEANKAYEKRQAEEKRTQDIKDKCKKLLGEAINLIRTAGNTTASEIRIMSPGQFEIAVCEMYRKLGYEVRHTPFSNDGGKDAVMHKNGEKHLLECKHYSQNQSIGRPDIQRFFAAMDDEGAVMGHFVNTGRFSEQAIEYAIKRNIETIDMSQLVELMRKAYPENQTPTRYLLACPVCGETVAFGLHESEERKICSNGHTVENTPLKYRYYEPNTSHGASSHHRPSRYSRY